MQQISAAQGDLTKVLADLGISDAARTQITLQLSNLSALRQLAAGATEATLQHMQAQIATTVANAQALASGGTEQASKDAPVTLAEASAKARQTAQDFVRDYYDNHKFEKDLKFQSEQDERDYREREAARNKAIEDALALQTDKGNALALKLSNEQWVDAKAHGASRSPDAQAMTEKLDEASQKLDAAVLAADSLSPSANQADQHIAALKKAGVTVADQTQHGHGVTVDASIAQLLGRG